MNILTKLVSLLAVAGLMLHVAGPASAAPATVAGRGKVVCDGDGVIVFSGDFIEGTVSTTAGVLVHSKPKSGTLKFVDAAGFTKYSATGNVTLHVGYGTATARNVKGVKVTLSGANAHFEIVGQGRLSARGDGHCTFANAQTSEWHTDEEVTIDVTQ